MATRRSLMITINNAATFNTGLPFHNHGKTWLAVMHGAKLWFLYPLGFGISTNLIPYHWFRDVLPTLQGYPMPPVQPWTSHSTSTSMHRPLTCLQYAGDIMFIPTQWLHMTLNVGETIAVGAQELLGNEERLKNAKVSYDNFRRDEHVLKGNFTVAFRVYQEHSNWSYAH